MRKQQRFPVHHLSATLALSAVAVLFCAVPGFAQSEPSAKDQLEFGVEMAKRGLWSEALFRFNHARRLDPDNPSVYNNLAVAHEALGLFEEALELYRQGLELSPQDRGLRNNYARFLDFYRRFKPDREDAGGDSEESKEEKADPEPTSAAGTEA